MITLEDDALVFRCPEVHPKAQFSLSHQRTLRIPDDGRDYPLRPGLGRFSFHLDFIDGALPWQRLSRSSVQLRPGIELPPEQVE